MWRSYLVIYLGISLHRLTSPLLHPPIYCRLILCYFAVHFLWWNFIKLWQLEISVDHYPCLRWITKVIVGVTITSEEGCHVVAGNWRVRTAFSSSDVDSLLGGDQWRQDVETTEENLVLLETLYLLCSPTSLL